MYLVCNTLIDCRINFTFPVQQTSFSDYFYHRKALILGIDSDEKHAIM